MEVLRVVWEEGEASCSRQAFSSPELYERLGHNLLMLTKPGCAPSEERGKGAAEDEEVLLQLLPYNGLQSEDEGIIVRGNGTSEWSGEKVPVRFVPPKATFLDEVLLESCTEESFRFSQNEEQEFRWHIAMGDLGRVVGEGDIVQLPAGQRFRVMHCSPFRQGLIPPVEAEDSAVLPSAKVVVLPPSGSAVGEEERPCSPPSPAYHTPAGLGFHSLLFPQSHTLEDVGGIHNTRAGAEVEITALSGAVAMRREQEVSDRDVTRRAYASFALMQALCISKGAWTKVTVGENECFLRLYPFPRRMATGGGKLIIAVPPTALFSLDIEATVEKKGRAYGSVAMAPVDDSKEGVAGEMPCGLATSIAVTRIASFNAYGHVSTNDISQYFSTPRIVCEGDVLLVWSKKLAIVEEARFKQGAKGAVGGEGASDDVQALYDELVKAEGILGDGDQDSIEERPVFYRVMTVKVEGREARGALLHKKTMAFVSADKTQLIENGGFVHSRIPRGYCEFMRGELPLIPVGQQASYSTLRDAMEPLVGMRCARALKNGIFCSFLVHGNHGSGKRLLVERVASSFGLHLIDVDCFDIVDAIDSRTVTALEDVFDDAFAVRPGILLLRNIGVLEKAASQQQRESLMAGAFRSAITRLNEKIRTGELNGSSSSLPNTVTVIATETKADDLSANLRSCFSHELRLESPDEHQRFAMVEEFLMPTGATNSTARGVGSGIFARSIAMQTAGCTGGDLEALTALSRANSLASKRAIAVEEREMEEDMLRCLGASLTTTDLTGAFERIQTAQAEEMGAPKVPNVRWDDVGGLADAKKDIVDTIQLPLSHPHLFAEGLRQRSGVLLYGPPGTGKTLLAKAVATECSLNFLSVKGPELINMYVGESEKNIRDVFQRARNARPCVIFFDELDSLAPNRGHGSDSGGVMDRVVSQLLAELDGLQKANSVFVIGATNRPDLLDPALLRPGRLDKLLYLGVCRTLEAQLPVLRALTRKFDLHADLKLEDVAKECPLTFTGADFYALCTDALMGAMKERVALVDAVHALVKAAEASGVVAHIAEEKAKLSLVEAEPLLVEKRHFLTALPGITPSVSEAELMRYEEIRKKYS